MAEWSKAPDSKSGLGQPNGGSNPSLSATDKSPVDWLAFAVGEVGLGKGSDVSSRRLYSFEHRPRTHSALSSLDRIVLSPPGAALLCSVLCGDDQRSTTECARVTMPWMKLSRRQKMTGPAETGPVCPGSELRPALLPGLFSRHRVFEEILVLRCEAFRKLENLKAVAITDGPELDIG